MKYYLTIVTFLCLFYAKAQPANDNALNAIDVTSLVNNPGCSADAAYTTVNATADKNPGSCWNTTGGSNVWFWFTAPSSEVTVNINTGGSQGTLRYLYVALWDSDTISQLACKNYSAQYSDLEMSYVGLTPGMRYFISVDNHNGSSSYEGTFQICMDSSATYDFVEGAIFVDSLIDNCSPDASYTTVQATSDQSPGSCWNTTGGSNRWFAFVATSPNVQVEVLTGGSQGTLRYAYASLWNSDLSTELACINYTSQYSDLSMSAVGLTIGDTFYISVDNHNGSTSYRGTFALCISSQSDYDFYESPIYVDSLIDACSPDASYTTGQATSDQSPGSCWNTTGGSNRWFAFVATSSSVEIEVLTGGSQGTLRYAYAALWNSDLSSQLACVNYTSQYSDLSMSAVGLTIGDTFYISVDNHNGSASYRGSFALCISSVSDYDFYESAIFVDSLMNTCSADASFTTVQATKDQSPGSCWNTVGGSNRWFAFVATATQVKVRVLTGGSQGTLRYGYAALWNSDLSSQLACVNYTSQYSDLEMNAVGLTIGDTFYISVDNHNGSASYRGSFALCLEDQVDYDFYEGAYFVDSIMNNCSPDAHYTTVQATSDQSPGSCWNTTGGSNRWFAFVATTTQARIEVRTGGSEGTLRYGYTALWNSDLSSQVACQRYTSQYSDITLNAVNLTAGDTFYISVDNHNGSPSYRGTFKLCLYDSVDYDFQEGARTLYDIVNWCSSDALFTTVQATADKNSGSCWNTAGGSNRWFQFTATTAEINVEVLTGGSQGTLRYAYVALWDTDGLTQLACERYTSQYSDLDMDYVNLTPGNTYYISVDNHNGSSSYRGTFTLCVNDKVTYDFYEAAEVLTDLNGWCSGNGQYNTQLATQDQNPGSCWNTFGGSNRWFTFQAISPSVVISMNTGGSEGTLRYPYLALWDSTGTGELDCQRYTAQYSDLTISYTGLTVGDDYYISVDNHNGSTSYRGTFQLCVSNVSDTLYSRADGAWSNASTWSEVNHGGPAASGPPSFGDVVNIEHNVTLGSDVEVAEINLNVATGQSTSLSVTDAVLDVRGKMNFANPNNDQSGTLTLSGNTRLEVLDTLHIQRDGGSQAFNLTLVGTSQINVFKSLDFDINGGTAANNLVTLNNSSSIVTLEDLIMDNDASGTKLLVQLNDTATLVVFDNIYYTTSADDFLEIELNDSSQLFMGGNFNFGTPRYGILDCNNFSSLVFQSLTNLQNFPGNEGSGTGDDFTYQNVVINNARVTRPQVTMDGPITISGNILFVDGVIGSTSANLLTLADGATISGQSDISYVEGPIQRFGSSDFLYPVGASGFYAPLELNSLSGANSLTEFTVEYFANSYSDVTNLGAGLYNVSTLEYWDIAQVGSLDSLNLTLHWRSATRSEIDNYSELKIVHYTGGQWENMGQDSNVPGLQGSITVNGVSSFSPFTFGSNSTLANPLPVDFLYVDAIANEQTAEIIWGTGEESEAEIYVIERSGNLIKFEVIGTLEGHGDVENHYSFSDRHPYRGLNYYRIKNISENGNSTFSDVVSVEVQEGALFSLFPNPVENGLLHLSMAPDFRPQTFKVINTNGEMLFKLRADGNPNQDIRINSLPSGVYILVAEDGQSVEKRKFIVR